MNRESQILKMMHLEEGIWNSVLITFLKLTRVSNLRALWLRVLATFAEDPSSVPRTHTVAHNHLTPAEWNEIPSSDLYRHHAHMWHTYTSADRALTHIHSEFTQVWGYIEARYGTLVITVLRKVQWEDTESKISVYKTVIVRNCIMRCTHKLTVFCSWDLSSLTKNNISCRQTMPGFHKTELLGK